MEKNVFDFHVQEIACGWCRVSMLINDKQIHCFASYTGDNPLASFINACAEFTLDGNDYYTVWNDEPGKMSIEMNLDESKLLHFNITQLEDETEKDSICGEWHESIPFDVFLSKTISEGFRVLNAFGLIGYLRSWQREDFPLALLLRLTGDCKILREDDSCCTDISEEIEVLQKRISKLAITEETELVKCAIYYESWQIQCCGDPFSVGDKVDWTCIMPSGYKNAHGIITDFEENHHGFATHSISGTVTKIIAERSEFPKGKREVWYDKACVIHEEIQHADGWESEYKDDDTTERTFWGYIIMLKDVTVKPLK